MAAAIGLETAGQSATKGWRLTLFGDVRAVERAFGVDAASAVLLASSSAFGHHEPTGAGWSTYV